MSASSSEHVLIIGAGICGLAIAHGLQRAGINFTIFEAEDSTAFRPREWTMALHWSIPMLDELLSEAQPNWKHDAAVDPSLDYMVYPNNSISIYDGISGKIVNEIVTKDHYLRVSRRKLRDVCKKDLLVKYDHRLVSVTEQDDGTVLAKFANGLEYQGTMLVGSDGPRSLVRKQIFGADTEQKALEVTYMNISFRYQTAEQALFVRGANPVTAICVHPDMICLTSVQDVPSIDPQTWRFQLVATWLGDRTEGNNQDKQLAVKKRSKVLCEPFASAIAWMPEDVEIQYSDVSSFTPRSWDVQSVTLAGDAAHAMPPNRGQGLNNAINDAHNFVNSVKLICAGANRKETLQQYSDEMVSRGAKEVNLSVETARLMMDYEKYMSVGIKKHTLDKQSA